MATPESTLKQWMRKQAIAFAKEHNMEMRWDQPQPGRFGTRGRPDVYLDLGPVHFRIEVKDHENKPASGLQDVFMSDDQAMVPHRCVLVCGKAGARQFFEALPRLIERQAAELMHRLMHVLDNPDFVTPETRDLPEPTVSGYLEFRG